ncbi:MAG TPA: hypothetical protein VNA19_13040 [Pyrinomonadaceae bacterium]|nr:hypothetical protein [Pyrinomonadaceae bacterium]
MKKQALRVVVMFALLFSLATVGANAQTAQQRIVVNIPFEFVVGQKTLPAGEYDIKRIARNSEKALLVRSTDGRKSEMIITHTAEAGTAREAQPTQVSFHRYGDKYFLFQIWTQGASVGRELPASQQERDLRRELERNTSKMDIAHLISAPQTVHVKARLK